MRRCKGIVSTKSGLNVFVISLGLKLYHTVNLFQPSISVQLPSLRATILHQHLHTLFPRSLVMQCVSDRFVSRQSCILKCNAGWWWCCCSLLMAESQMRMCWGPDRSRFIIPHSPSITGGRQRSSVGPGVGGDLGMSVWGTLCSEYPTGCSVQHVLRRASCSVAQWLVQPVQHPRVEVIDWEKQKIGRGYRKSINVITPAERAGTIRIQEGLILYFPKLPNFWFNKTKRCWGIGGGPRWGISDPSMAGQVCFTIKALFYFFAFPMSWNFLLLQHTNKILDAHSKNWTTRPGNSFQLSPLKPAHV